MFKNRIKLLDTRPRKLFFAQAGFGISFTNLTSGVFLSSLALWMGANDILVSYLSVIINICGVLILFVSPLLERFLSRKRLTLTLTVLSRLATLFIVAVPVLFPPELRMAAFVTAVVVAFTLQAQTTVVLNQWMLVFVDEQKKGRYISLRQTLTVIVAVVLSPVGGWWLDYTQNRYFGFAVLFGVAAVAGIFEVILLARIPDYRIERASGARSRFRDLAKLPFRNRRFLGFCVYIVFFYLFLYIGDSFTMVFMMKYLALPNRTVTALYLIMSLPQIVLTGICGKIGDRRGAKFALRASIWLFAGETLFMFFVTPNTWYIFIPIAFLFASVGNAGFLVSVFTRRYELMPAENRIVYDNFYTAAVGLAFILGPLLGGAVKGAIETDAALSAAIPFANIRVLYLVSTAGLLLLQIIGILIQSRAKKSAARMPAPDESAPVECACSTNEGTTDLYSTDKCAPHVRVPDECARTTEEGATDVCATDRADGGKP